MNMSRMSLVILNNLLTLMCLCVHSIMSLHKIDLCPYIPFNQNCGSLQVSFYCISVSTLTPNYFIKSHWYLLQPCNLQLFVFQLSDWDQQIMWYICILFLCKGCDKANNRIFIHDHECHTSPCLLMELNCQCGVRCGNGYWICNLCNVWNMICKPLKTFCA